MIVVIFIISDALFAFNEWRTYKKKKCMKLPSCESCFHVNYRFHNLIPFHCITFVRIRLVLFCFLPQLSPYYISPLLRNLADPYSLTYLEMVSRFFPFAVRWLRSPFLRSFFKKWNFLNEFSDTTEVNVLISAAQASSHFPFRSAPPLCGFKRLFTSKVCSDFYCFWLSAEICGALD